MGTYSFKMPDVGEGVVEAEITEWHVKVGDAVTEDQPLVDVMTDKATVEIPSPVAGTVASQSGEPGEVLRVGSVLLTIEVDGDGNATADQPEKKPKAEPEPAPKPLPEPAPTPKPAPKPAPATRPAPVAAKAVGGKALASPAVRKRAIDADIDLSAVPGSGPAGRVTHQDLDDFIAAGGRLTARAGGGSRHAERHGETVQKVIGLRRKIARNLAASKRSIPHFAYVEEVEMDALEALRAHLNANKSPEQPKLTLLPFLSLALIQVVADYPQANAHFDGEVLTRFAPVHLGVATATPNGLMVPVVRHAESLDVWHLAAEIARVTQAARDGAATRDELTGSTITITSLGKLGGIVSTPVINAPETSIIGVNKLMDKLALDRGNVVPRKVMNLSSSFDHRVVDGFDAARLIQKVKVLLENPATLFM